MKEIQETIGEKNIVNGRCDGCNLSMGINSNEFNNLNLCYDCQTKLKVVK